MITPGSEVFSRSRPPVSAGATPQRRALPALLLLVLPLFAGCANTDANQTQPPVDLGMTNNTPAFYNDGQNALYQVQLPVQLPVREPTALDLKGLGTGVQPYPRQPFLLASDESVEIHFTLSNIDDQDHTVWLMFDAWNEFVRYRPGLLVTQEGASPNWSTYMVPYVVPAKGRYVGTLTTDDTKELAIKLATIENIIANVKPVNPMDPNAHNAPDPGILVNRAANWQNRLGDGDPVVGQYIPSVIAGLTGFDLGLRTDAAVNVAVEITIDVTDLNGNRMVPPGQATPLMAPPQTVLSPPGAR
jgi:hypothetical protein